MVDADEYLYERVRDFLDKVGGRCSALVVQKNFKVKEHWLRERFDVSKDIKARQEDVLVKLRKSEEHQHFTMDVTARRVAKHLVKTGGTADLHDVTRRFAIKKTDLLAHAGGRVFEACGTRLCLKGGFRAVAATAAAAGVARDLPGRLRPGEMFTSMGVPTDDAAAEKLRLRIEAFLTSAGDGLMPAKAVYTALGLKPTPALRRWFKRVGIKMVANGELEVPKARLAYYRVQRAVTVSAMIAAGGGRARFDDVISRIYFPPEFSNSSRPHMEASGEERPPSPQHQTLQLPLAAESVARGDAMPQAEAQLPAKGATASEAGAASEAAPDSETERLPYLDAAGVPEDASDSSEATENEPTAHIGRGGPLARPTVPVWIPVWVRNYFKVTNGFVEFPEGPRPRKPWQPSGPGPEAPPPISFAEEVANLMKVEEEIRLRYGRAHIGVLTGCFEGVRQSWVRRFFDITIFGDVLPKSANRQIAEAIAIAKRIVAGEATARDGSGETIGHSNDGAAGAYTAEDAFHQFGASQPWLRDHFFVEELTGVLALDAESKRAWKPPEGAPKPPSPYSYAKLNVPRGYIRKGDGRYYPRKYGHSAGGILY